MPDVNNGVLLRKQSVAPYSILFDSNDTMRRRKLKRWVTDRPAPLGGWTDDVDLPALLEQRVSPILCLTHPHHWSAGPPLWVDRGIRVGARSARNRLRRDAATARADGADRPRW
jgi:hypothetical protein